MCVCFRAPKVSARPRKPHARKTIIMMMMAAAAAAAVVLVAPKAQLYQLFSLIDLAHSATPLSMYVCVCMCVYALCSAVMLNECQTISRALTKIKPTQFLANAWKPSAETRLDCELHTIGYFVGGVEGDVGWLGWIQIFVDGVGVRVCF